MENLNFMPYYHSDYQHKHVEKAMTCKKSVFEVTSIPNLYDFTKSYSATYQVFVGMFPENDEIIKQVISTINNSIGYIQDNEPSNDTADLFNVFVIFSDIKSAFEYATK